MESTGIYWKNIYAALEKSGLRVSVVNARHVKQVPGRKTDVKDSQWLARLARYGLVKGSFIPPKDLRELRIIARYRTKLVGTLAGEKNRLHKTLDDAGVRLGTECQFKHKYKSLMIRRGHKKAIVAVGHKMLRVIYSRLKTGEVYQDPQVSYEELVVKKNAPSAPSTFNLGVN